MSEPNRDARRRRIVERVKEGETRQEIMQKEKISRVTLWSDLKALDSLFLTENSAEIKELKRPVGHALSNPQRAFSAATSRRTWQTHGEQSCPTFPSCSG